MINEFYCIDISLHWCMLLCTNSKSLWAFRQVWKTFYISKFFGLWARPHSITAIKSARCPYKINHLTPNDPCSGRTAPLTSKRFILYIYSTNTGTEYFELRIYCLFFCLQSAVCFIILTYLVPVLFMFYIQDVPKFKKIILTPKG